jgi:hexokinase
MDKRAEDFLRRHGLMPSTLLASNIINTFTGDMDGGLRGVPGSLRMIPTYVGAEGEYLRNKAVLAIDAGGTNFRAALVSVDNKGKTVISETVNKKMPGLDGEISSRDFFNTIAEYIRPLASMADRIGFCFSYPTEIFPDRDGKLITFCKEVRAPEVHGKIIGRELLSVLGTPEKTIVLLNDTVATLLAGKARPDEREFSSFIGFILGTGTNTCYIEKNTNILKCPGLDRKGSMIINVESGDYGKPPRTETDVLFDSATNDPGRYMFEKMFAGGYLGNLVLFVLKRAAAEGIFSSGTAAALSIEGELQTSELSTFMAGTAGVSNQLVQFFKEDSDRVIRDQIIDSMITRAAVLSSSALAAVVLKCGEGMQPGRPVLITVEGTTFYRLPGFREKFETNFNHCLSGASRRYTLFTGVENSGLAGAALAALMI